MRSELSRRGLLRTGFAAAVTAAPAFAIAGPALASVEPRRVALNNLHTGESVSAVFWENGGYVPDALAAINKVLRDFRTGEVHMIDPRLLDLLDGLRAKVESRSPFAIISGYRSPRTNANLHKASSKVAVKSLHMDGMAADIRLPDVQLAHLRKAALEMRAGGVGYYPADNFVHVDVGRVRTW